MPINLNSIGKASAHKLDRGCVGKKTAFALLAARDAGGDFASWDDVISRVDGFGPAKRDALKMHNIEVRRRPAVDERTSEESASFVDGTTSVRDANVGARERETWEYRANLDMYTGLSKSKSENVGRIQVDHVVEVQVLNFVHSQAASTTRCSRATERTLSSLLNSTSNLNCTTMSINQAKKGPITRWLHDYQDACGSSGAMSGSLSTSARESVAGRKLIDQGVWSGVERGIVNVFDELNDRVENMDQSPASKYLLAYTAELELAIAGMQL